MKPTRIHTLPADYRLTVRARVHARSQRSENGCIEWTGGRDRYGYGKFNLVVDGRRRQTGAHRAAWLADLGDIPDGLVIDHLCRNRACVNVEHMELVTGAENTRRGELKRKSGKRPDGVRLYCSKHGRDDGYVFERRTTGYRIWVCRICRRKSVAEYQARQRAV